MAETEVRMFTGGFTFTNGYVFRFPGGAIGVDAPDGMADWLSESGVKVDALFLTHCHFDHVTDAARIAREHGCPVAAWGPSTPESRLEDHLRQWTGIQVSVEDYPVNVVLEGSGSVELAGRPFRLAHVPGHSPDSLVLIDAAAELAFTGDTLMEGGVGRSDFPGGDGDLLLRGIREHILTLPERFRLYPGHGRETTVRREAASNPFL